MALKGRDVPEIGFKRKCTPSVSCGVRCQVPGIQVSGVGCQVAAVDTVRHFISQCY